MKKTGFAALLSVLLLVFCLAGEACAAGDVTIDSSNFPDANFRSYVTDNCDTDHNGVLSAAEISAVTEINVSWRSITDLTGIEQFTALTTLDCGGNQISSLSVHENTALKELNCFRNQLTSLDLSSCAALESLSCYLNQLTSLDVSGCMELSTLNCDSNQLTSLNVSGCTALTDMGCGSNELTSLDVSKNTALTSLRCEFNQLSSLDVSANLALTSLSCDFNQLTSLDVSANTKLGYLSCNGQVASAEMTEADGTYQLDLAALVGADHVNRVTITTVMPNVPYQIDNGVLTAPTELMGVLYTYAHGGPESSVMDVALATGRETVAVDEVNFPDSNFRSYVSQFCDSDQDGVLNAKEMLSVKHIYVMEREIADLRGIEHFMAATHLDCSNNRLTSLDLSANTGLNVLTYDNNLLTDIDLSTNTALTELACADNQLTSIDLSANTALEYLRCDGNELTRLDLSANTALARVNCSDNCLNTLLLGSKPLLANCEVNANQLEIVDISGCSQLLDIVENGTFTEGLSTQSYTKKVSPWMSNTFVYDKSALLQTEPDQQFGIFYLPDSLTEIEEEAFAGSTADKIVLPDGCRSVAARAFADCPKLQIVSAPEGTEIDAEAFSGSRHACVLRRAG